MSILWSAEVQNPGTSWTLSSINQFSMRVRLRNAFITSAPAFTVRFRGKASDNYSIFKASIAEQSGTTLDVVPGTWRPITFGGTWAVGALILAGSNITSDPIYMALDGSKDYFITFFLNKPGIVRLSPVTPVDTTYHVAGDVASIEDWSGLTISTIFPYIYCVELVESADPIVTNPAKNILVNHAGDDLSRWTLENSATKTTTNITFPQQASGNPARVKYTFPVGRFALNTAHRFTGLLTPVTLNYPHTDVRWFVKNETTGEVKFHQMTFDGHADKGGQSEVGEPKPFNIVFYSKSFTDQFSVGFENIANGQQGCVFAVSSQGVFIVL